MQINFNNETLEYIGIQQFTLTIFSEIMKEKTLLKNAFSYKNCLKSDTVTLVTLEGL